MAASRWLQVVLNNLQASRAPWHSSVASVMMTLTIIATIYSSIKRRSRGRRDLGSQVLCCAVQPSGRNAHQRFRRSSNSTI